MKQLDLFDSDPPEVASLPDAPIDDDLQPMVAAIAATEQGALFGDDLPTIEQQDFRTIYVHFESRDDVDAFATLIGQRIQASTRMIDFPPLLHLRNTRYIQ